MERSGRMAIIGSSVGVVRIKKKDKSIKTDNYKNNSQWVDRNCYGRVLFLLHFKKEDKRKLSGNFSHR